MRLSPLAGIILASVHVSLAVHSDKRQDGPVDPGTNPDCTFFETVLDVSQDCAYLEARWGLEHEDFVAWNPSVKNDCSGIKVGNSYCVEAPQRPTSTSTSATSTGKPGPTGPATPSPTQPGLIDTCTMFYKAVSGDTCDKIVKAHGGAFTTKDFILWNPAVGDDCTGLWAETYYCVGIPGTPTAPPKTSTTSSTKSATSTGSPKPSPTQEGLIESCVRFYKAASGDTCDGIVSKHSGTFTLVQFYLWNPAVSDGCRNLLLDTYYCVGIPGTPTTPPKTSTTSSTRTTSSTGSPKPSPTQNGLISSCVRFYKAVSGDTCDGIVSKHGGTFTLTQFYVWNPAVSDGCRNLLADTYYCVGIPGTPTSIRTTTTSTTLRTTTTSTTRRTTTTSQGNGIATPTPTQRLVVNNCDKFYFVREGETCQAIAARHGISQDQFYKWNPSVTTGCVGLWANAYACVRTIGYVYPVSISCYASGKTWGDNKPAALNSVVEWCKGNDNTDGSGGFATNQVKHGCFNAPFGTNKLEFWVRNDFGVGQSLSVARCNELARIPVDRCARGGVGSLESWNIRAAVSDGRC